MGEPKLDVFLSASPAGFQRFRGGIGNQLTAGFRFQCLFDKLQHLPIRAFRIETELAPLRTTAAAIPPPDSQA